MDRAYLCFFLLGISLHNRDTVHRNGCGPTEWHSRLVLAMLVDLHVAGVAWDEHGAMDQKLSDR